MLVFQANFTRINGVAMLSSVNCTVGQPGECTLMLCARSTYNSPVNFGGLKFSVTLDSLYTVDAQDLRNGNYTITIPSEWSNRVGQHNLTIKADGRPIVFCNQDTLNRSSHCPSMACPIGVCGTPFSNPITLNVLPIECASGSNTSPDSHGTKCVCNPGTIPQADGSCKVCPANTYPSSIGRIACFKEDLLPVSENVTGNTCLSCADLPCIQCFVPGGVPTVAPGWMLHETSSAVRMDTKSKSKNVFACPGGAASCPGGSSSTCGNNHTGSLCAVCQPGFFSDRVHGSSICSACHDADLGWEVLGSVAVYATAGLTAAVLLKYGREYIRVDRTGAETGMERSCKIAMSYFQVASMLTPVLNLPLHNHISNVFATISKVGEVLYLNIGLFVAWIKCWGWSYYRVYLVEVLLIPAGLVLVLSGYSSFLIYRAGTQDEIQQHRNAFRNNLTWLVFLLYPQLSKTIMAAFACRKLAQNEEYLVVDMRIDCLNNPDYETLKIVALVLTILIPFGVPFAILSYFAWRYHKNATMMSDHQPAGISAEDLDHNCCIPLKHSSIVVFGMFPGMLAAMWISPSVDMMFAGMAISAGTSFVFLCLFSYRETTPELLSRNKQQLCSSFGQIVQDYKPEFFFFEMIDWMRKAVLSAGLTAFDRGSTQQALVGMLVSCMFFITTLRCQPFVKASHNLLKTCEEAGICIVFFVSILLHADSTAYKSEDTGNTRQYEVLILGSITMLSVSLVLEVLLLLNHAFKLRKFRASLVVATQSLWSMQNTDSWETLNASQMESRTQEDEDA